MIDWRQCARSTKLYVRDKDRPPPQTVYFWADRSPRMHKQPNPSSPAKADRAFTIAFALSHMLLRGGEKVVWLGPHLLTVNGMTGFRTLTSHFLPLQKTEELPPVTKISRHAHMIIFSDFSSSSEYRVILSVLMPDSAYAARFAKLSMPEKPERPSFLLHSQ